MNAKTLRNRVAKIINENQEAADNENVLISAIWRQDGWNDMATLETNLRTMTRPENISRRRRELFNLGLIEYSDKASKRRTKAFLNERNRASPIPPRVDSLLKSDEYKQDTQALLNSQPPEQGSLL